MSEPRRTLDWHKSDPSYRHAKQEFRTLKSHAMEMSSFIQPPGHYRPRSGDDFFLQWLANDAEWARVDHGHRFVVQPRRHHLAIAPPNTDLGYDVRSELRGLNMVIPRSVVAERLASASASHWGGDFGELHSRAFEDPVIAAFIAALWSEAQEESPRGTLFVESAVETVLLRLHALSAGHSDGVEARFAERIAGFLRGGLPPRQLARVTDHARTRLAEDISISELSAVAGLSAYHFARAFKHSTGLPPHAWLTARRIERAQELMLAHREMGLVEVALAVGYSSQTAFGAAFRRVVGVPPAEWRRQRAG